ncbi:nicotinate-nucleotide--dimethylbenzimidazole phosphoribosyltransferase [Desulfomicrobium baculatum]|uniref:Nicotinate-nucleotide--dimethylbenzimidazole phosphoribosyltransferase n=1 Tax=Desulfomicrobium baculatum (strain DSM 4028 / VKM B-1378 / X) TaxID=525897 RepID=C7LWF8_DESBD|nr:nicotinate-nucleotide--dimethylbenzimidazole phosphoribosyltransferase [Desulfomicrobium baculatum]ACU88650.1 nicotinate-nucleotide/dimethylbenzimidazolephosp horibosyltransferase [Desulfomicrobium baculatum DSM 4028]
MLQSTIAQIRPLDRAYFAQAQAHLDSQTKPKGSLGVLEQVACRLVAMAGGEAPRVDPARIYTCAGDHGVAAQGVSLFPQEVTRQMVANFVMNGAAINVLTRTAGVDLKVVDAGCLGGKFPDHPALVQCKVAPGTKDLSTEAAMSREECVRALENGIALAKAAHAEGIVTLGSGEMGIANTTPATALFCAYLNLAPAAITGPGTGLGADGVRHKIAVIEKALALHEPTIAKADPLDILACLGGFEIATLAGMILGGASLGMPLVIDGFISSSAYVAARAICPLVAEYAFFSHASAEPGFAAVMNRLDATPLLHLGLRLGEGTGAAMAIFILRSAANLYTDMATFSAAGVNSGE